MINLRNLLELLDWGKQLLGSADNPPSLQWLDPFWAAVIAMMVGFILALWGGRILRVAFVFAWMFAGGVAGQQFAGTLRVDLLIGLVIGAGLAGVVGYLLYRWWLSLTVGVLAGLLVLATFSAPILLNARQGLDDYHLGVGSGRFDTSRSSQYTWPLVREYFLSQPQGRDVFYRAIGPVALAGFAGFVLALVAPKLASILGTSLLGVLVLAGGAAAMTATKWPDWWTSIQSHQGWAIVGIGCLWMFSMFYQVAHPARPMVHAPVAPVPAPTA